MVQAPNIINIHSIHTTLHIFTISSGQMSNLFFRQAAFDPTKGNQIVLTALESVSCVITASIPEVCANETFVFNSSPDDTPLSKQTPSGYVFEVRSNNTYSCLLFNLDPKHNRYNSDIAFTGRLPSIAINHSALSSILDPFGNIVHLKTFVSGVNRCTPLVNLAAEAPAPKIIHRFPVYEPLHTGILSVDALVPIGRGQRELIIGDRQTGKTSIALDTIQSLKYDKVISIYSPVGQKAINVLKFYLLLANRDANLNLVTMYTTAQTSSVLLFLSVYCATASAEFYMRSSYSPCFICYDDLAKQAASYRELSLILRRAPGREAFPGDIFYIHSRLLERSAKLSKSLGSGSITSFPIVEIYGGDVTGYVPTNLISITDGQIFLSTTLFVKGNKPAVDVGLSVSRVGSSAQVSAMKFNSSRLRLIQAQFKELEVYSGFSADISAETQTALNRGSLTEAMLKQDVGAPRSLVYSSVVLSLINDSYMMDQVCDLDKAQRESYRTKLNDILCAMPDWVSMVVGSRAILKSTLGKQG